MKKVMLKRCAITTLGLSLVVGLAACTNKDGSNGYDNEKTPLVIATQNLDGVFNPFFYTSGYDGEIVGTTQIGMLSTDNNGSVKVGDTEPCVVKNYTVETTDTRTDKSDDTDYDNYYTTYRFLIKNNIKFSDGTPLTIKDVLFNMYVYLDPAYSGSTTMYSTNIKGLKAYRSQSLDEGEQENAENKFAIDAAARIQAIRDWANDSLDDSEVAQVKADIETMKPLFKEELESDWNSAASSIADYDKTYKFTETWQVFLFNYGLISVKDKKNLPAGVSSESPEALEWNGWDKKGVGKDKTYFINAIYENMLGDDLDEDSYKKNVYSIVTYYATASNFKTQLTAQLKSEYYEDIRSKGELPVKSVSGITTETVTSFKGEALGGEYSVLQIVINGVDPKAIWNFSFTVAPMHYYSTAAEVNKFNISEGHFGVSFSDTDFMKQIQLKLVPLGAGCYKVTDKNGNAAGVSKVADFFNDNIVYYERNEYFFSPAKIKYLRYKVISSNKLFDAVTTGEVDYADPSALATTVSKINTTYKDKVGYALVDNLGYGYIGVNSKYINAIEVRRAIMYTMDTTLVLQYYTNEMASLIYRPMSKVSWAYPSGVSSPYYQDLWHGEWANKTDDERIEFICNLVEEAGYEKNSKGIYSRSNPTTGKTETLKLTFTCAGETTDHPAYNTFTKSAAFLNRCGFDVTVTNDPNALSKLSSGLLTVWAAAWSSTIDPDMYQVYHKDSTATSVNNWGYPFLLENGTEEELEIIDSLSELIDDGRATTDQATRKTIYANALDKVMDLAVELPTYQRKNLYVYNKQKIDQTTLCQEITPYNGPLSRIWEVSFNTAK